jgi:hypothetical protein
LQEDGSITALTLALAAGMAVGSDGAERISTESQESFLGSGYWEGALLPASDEEPTVKMILQPGLIILGKEHESCKWVDEGWGRCRVTMGDKFTCEYMCIYKREVGKLIVCFRDGGLRPTGFHSNKAQGLWVLKLAKSPKK